MQNISRYKDLYGKKTILSVAYECKRFQNYTNILKRRSSLKLGVSSFLCGFRADLWPFNGIFFGTDLLSQKDQTFAGYTNNNSFFSQTNPYSERYATVPMVAI